MIILIRWLCNAAAIMMSAYVLPGVVVNDFWTAVWLAVVWGLINALFKPVLIILTLPINILTLGLFTFVINGFIVWLASWLVSGLSIANFWWAILFSVVVAVFNAVLSRITLRD